jgi:hypothetical protein
MKTFVFALGITFFLIASCDKIQNAYPKSTTTLDWSLYPAGDSATYASNGYWPSFTENTNTLRNCLIEDFTGHNCPNCPNTANAVHNSVLTNPERIFETSIHSGPNGLGSFQQTTSSLTTIFYNTIGLEIGTFMGSIPGNSFIGNPRIAINRIASGTDLTSTAGLLPTRVPAVLSSTLKVNLQAKVNYFASTRGVFLHTEVDPIDPGLNEMGIVVYVVEDSLIAPQKTNDPAYADSNSTISNYVHRDIMRGTIDNAALGRTLSSTYLNSNGKYYVNYSYQLPTSLVPENTHLLIYVFDKVTNEILHVIKKKIE